MRDFFVLEFFGVQIFSGIKDDMSPLRGLNYWDSNWLKSYRPEWG